MGIILETENQNCYIEATNNPLEYVASGVNVGGQLAYKSAYRSANFGLTLIFDQPTTVTVRNPSAQTLNVTQRGDYYVCAYTINWFSHSTYTSLTNVPVISTQADFEAYIYDSTPPVPAITSNGGGATHIAKRTGQLKDLSSNLSDILMVSGGGGGGLLSGETEYIGKEAGGISGSGDNSADQSTGNAFGQGESGTNVSGGGSGLYGGYKGTSSKSGGAGSGYIGNSLVNNKKMIGYNVPTSSAEGTKTESVNDVSANPVSGKPKSGNGFARIKFLNPLYTLLTATYVDDKITESKWGDKVKYAEWANLQSGGRMTCGFDGQNNFIGFNDSSPSYYGYHDAMNMIQPFSKGDYKYLIFKTDVVFEYSSEYEGLIVVRDDYIANSSTKIGTLWTSPIQKTVPYNQESTVIIDISSLNDTIYIYLITHKVKRFKIKEMYLG